MVLARVILVFSMELCVLGSLLVFVVVRSVLLFRATLLHGGGLSRFKPF